MDKPHLAGRRILVVEDDFILAAALCAQIEDYGGVVVGPAPTLEKGCLLLQAEPLPDGCIFDIRLGEQMVYPLADSVMRSGVPLIFASNESRASIPETYAAIPLMAKPVSMTCLAKRLISLSP